MQTPSYYRSPKASNYRCRNSRLLRTVFFDVWPLVVVAVLFGSLISQVTCSTTFILSIDKYTNAQRRLPNGFQCFNSRSTSVHKYNCKLLISVNVIDHNDNFATQSSQQALVLSQAGIVDFRDSAASSSNPWLADGEYKVPLAGKPVRLLISAYHTGEIFNATSGDLMDADFALMDYFDVNLTAFLPVVSQQAEVGFSSNRASTKISQGLYGVLLQTELNIRFSLACDEGFYGIFCDMQCSKIAFGDYYRCTNVEAQDASLYRCLVAGDMQAVNCTICQRFDGDNCIPFIVPSPQPVVIEKENATYFTIMIAVSAIAVLEIFIIFGGIIYIGCKLEQRQTRSSGSRQSSDIGTASTHVTSTGSNCSSTGTSVKPLTNGSIGGGFATAAIAAQHRATHNGSYGNGGIIPNGKLDPHKLAPPQHMTQLPVTFVDASAVPHSKLTVLAVPNGRPPLPPAKPVPLAPPVDDSISLGSSHPSAGPDLPSTPPAHHQSLVGLVPPGSRNSHNSIANGFMNSNNGAATQPPLSLLPPEGTFGVVPGSQLHQQLLQVQQQQSNYAHSNASSSFSSATQQSRREVAV